MGDGRTGAAGGVGGAPGARGTASGRSVRGGGGSGGRVGAPQRAAGGGFRHLVAATSGAAGEAASPGPGDAPAAAALAGVAPPDLLVAVQERAVAAEPRAADVAAQSRAAALLSELQSVQTSLLLGSGRLTRDRLTRLAALAEEGAVRPPPADPALREILAAVHLRARVELARHEPAARLPSG